MSIKISEKSLNYNISQKSQGDFTVAQQEIGEQTRKDSGLMSLSTTDGKLNFSLES